MITTKPKICLTTQFNKKYEKIGRLCLLSLKKYAQQYGYDVKVINEIVSNRPPFWNKVLIAKKLLGENYDFVFWMDADALFTRFDKNIADEIEPNKDLYITSINDDDGTTLLTGVFLIRNSQWSKDFLNQVWSMQNYSKHLWHENAAFIDVLGLANQLPPIQKKLFPISAFQKKPSDKVKIIPYIWNEIRYRPERKDQLPIVRHYVRLDYGRLWYMSNDAYKTSLITKKQLFKNRLAYLKLKPLFDFIKYRLENNFGHLLERFKK
ncbi:MAG: putative nucleotide-diphospho-sugar transferase [Patescibacteria group bacterium]